MNPRDDYRPRIVDTQVKEYLATFGAVCIEGAKWCGKTWTSLHHAASHIYLGSPENNFSNRQLAQMSPSLVLQGDTPRLIDEWQEAPSMWDAVRHEVDQRGTNGQFILTGSATPTTKGIMHSGAGRIALLRMRPMTLFESGHSTGRVSLNDLMQNQLEDQLTGEVALTTIVGHILRGGWPGTITQAPAQASTVAKQYISAIVNSDIQKLDATAKNTDKVQLLLRSLARNEATTVTVQKLVRDIKDVDEETLDRRTVSTYLTALGRLFLIDDQPAYAPNLRSSIRLKGAAKRHLVDPSLAAALLGASEQMLLGDLETLGFLFEALCERDLRIYAEASGGSIFHYQDYHNNEIDTVIEDAQGNWHAFEIKLGAGQIDSAADNLLRIHALFVQKDSRPPASMTVVCGLTNAAYTRPDGVHVVPLTALKP